ncbi:MAG: MATE family efflux transporter [Rhodobacterales bacterium]|nr:MATE family efflux transporter [Rhodobacterales bacterium]
MTTNMQMSYGGHIRAVFALGLPLVGSNVAQFAITLTDAFMLGWYSVEALAAQVLGGMVFFTLFIVGAGFAQAVMPMVARAAANDDDVQVRRVTRMGLWISAAFGVLVLPVMIYSEALLVLLGQQPEVADLAGQYLVIVGASIVPALLVMVLKNYLSALERAQIVLWITIGAVLVNVLFNYALIFGNWGAPEMGIRGAAVASIAVHIVSVILLVIYVQYITRAESLFARLWRPDWEAFGLVFRLGWPIGLTSLAEVGLFASASIMMGWLGTVALAAHGIALQIISLLFMVHLGLSSVATVRAGRALGRGDAIGLRRGAKVAIAMSLIVSLASVVVFIAIPEVLIGVFLNPNETARAEVISIGIGLLMAGAVFQLVDGAQVMALGLLRGMQDTRVPMIIAGLSYWVVGVPASYVMGFTLGWGGVGIWLGLAVGLALAGVFMMVRFWGWSVNGIDTD